MGWSSVLCNCKNKNCQHLGQIMECFIYEQRHEIYKNVVCATNKASDQPANMRSLIRAFASCLNIMSVRLLTEHHLEFLSLTGGCTGSAESTLVKIPHCWKSHFCVTILNLDQWFRS